MWSDGHPVTAGDFVFAWKRALDPAIKVTGEILLSEVKNAKAYKLGQLSDPDLIGVRSLDDHTLEVELEGPTGYFLYLLTHTVTYPVPQHIVEAYRSRWTEPEHLVTNGPFILASWQHGDSLSLKRNPSYHGRLEGNVQQVEYIFKRTLSERLELYAQDKLNLFALTGQFGTKVFTDPDTVRRQYAKDYISAASMNTTAIHFNTTRTPFHDRRVRQAFSQSIDRNRWADEVRRGTVYPATGGFIPLGMPGHSADIGLPYDPERARRLLAEAGYPKGKGFPIVTLIVPSIYYSEFHCEHLQRCWQTALGVEVEWNLIEFPAFYDRLFRNEGIPHMFLSGWGADHPDPDNFLRVGALSSPTGWRDEEYIQLVEQARWITNQATRMKLYRQADRILMQEAPILPLAYLRSHLLVKPWVKRYPLSPMGSCWFWKDVVIEPH